MKIIKVNEPYQTGYEYGLTAKMGADFDLNFKPELTPQEMLALGVFGGSYFKTPPKEFPASWFPNARLSQDGQPHKELNFFNVAASQPLQVWQAKGWIYPEDPLGWFLWYCRYYQGRRIPDEDQRQIKRWRNMRRHISQLEKFCTPGDTSCQPRQRQALLHWAYDTRKI